MATAMDLLHNRRGVIYSVAPEQPVLDAIKQMATHGVGALLVIVTFRHKIRHTKFLLVLVFAILHLIAIIRLCPPLPPG